MFNFACKFARACLLFYSLTPPHIFTKCENNQKKEVKMMRQAATDDNILGIFALVQRTKTEYKQPICGATWIDSNFLITAASCLDNKASTLWTTDKMEKRIKVKVLHMENVKGSPEYRFPESFKRSSEDDPDLPTEAYTGEALLHPLYKKSPDRDMPCFYDVAVVKIAAFKNFFGKRHAKGLLCTPAIVSSVELWNAIGLTGSKKRRKTKLTEVKELEPTSNKEIAVFEGECYYIDPAQQFTTWKKLLKPSSDFYITGGPIIARNVRSETCIAGVVSFGGYKEGEESKLFFTSTKVYTDDVRDWIKHAKKLGNWWGTPNKKKNFQFVLTQLIKDLRKEKFINISNSYNVEDKTIYRVRAGSPLKNVTKCE